MIERWRGRVAAGMQVKSSDGEKLGKVVECQGTGFVVEKGFLFPKDIIVPYDRISDIRGSEILISLARADLGERAAEHASAKPMEEVTRMAKSAVGAVKEAVTGNAGNAGTAHASLDQFGKGGEILIPLAEEEVIATKHVERVGEVHVRKEVITEEKRITVPVTREVLRVERVPVSHDVRSGEAVFEKESYDIPISEEHVTVEKRPVVREELRIGKEVQQAEETASTTVRRERAEVETMGPVRTAEVPSNDQSVLRPTGTGGKR